jgi:hypothetical protein
MYFMSKLDRLLSNGHKLLSHLGHLGAKIGPGTLRQGMHQRCVEVYIPENSD